MRIAISSLLLLLPSALWAQADSSRATTPHDSVSARATVNDTSATQPIGTAQAPMPVVDKDTVYVPDPQSAQPAVMAFEYVHRPLKSREKGYGGCIGPTMGVFGLDMRSVHRVMQKVPDNYREIDATIDERMEPFTLWGGRLYGGVGNGIRFGLAGAGGGKTFGNPVDTADSVSEYLQIGVGYGGFLLEKSIVAGNFNILIGGLMGAGGMGLGFFEGDLFATDNTSEVQQTRGEFGAGFVCLELHAGFTYTIVPWLHIGAEGSALGFLSSGGFKNPRGIGSFGSFYTVNPGGQVRIVLGNIG